MDEVVFIILSQMTTHHSCNRVFERLKHAVPRWDNVLDMSVSELERLIHDAGLSNQKAPRISGILEKINVDFGSVTLEPLGRMSDATAERYLLGLPGVGVKSARCVLMYSLGRAVLPADTHVWRVARRLGLVADTVTYPRLHDVLHRIVRPADRYRFHVNAIPLGRKVCIAKRPRCSTCPLMWLCPTGRYQA
ncbi:MAG: endonuclease III domain-containing protein [bacterium]